MITATDQYPHAPGYKVAGPSREAATAERGRAATFRDLVLQYLTEREGTADECAEWCEASVLTIRPRFSELLKLGKIEDSGVRRKNESGHAATVWRVVRTQRQEEFKL